MKMQDWDTNTKFEYYQRIADEFASIENLKYRTWKTQRLLEKENEYIQNFSEVAEAEFFVKHVNNAASLRAELTKLEEDIKDRQYRVDHNFARIDSTEFFAYMKQMSEKRDNDLLQMLEHIIQNKSKSGNELEYKNSNGLKKDTVEAIQLLTELHAEIKGSQSPK